MEAHLNYYERHIGDYLKDTAHLSLLEHGVYGRLLDVYYTRERGIDNEEAARIVGARSREERSALERVLFEFFHQEPSGTWTHGRCDREIERYRDKQRKASASANERWKRAKTHSEGNADAMRTHSEGNAPNHQTPDTRHQEDACASSARAPSSPQAEVCKALKSAGIADVNPGHPRLLALLEAGATLAEFTGFASKALQAAPGNAFAYLLSTVEGERKRVAGNSGKLHTGPMPTAALTAPPPASAGRVADILRDESDAFKNRTPEQIAAAKAVKDAALAAVRRA